MKRTTIIVGAACMIGALALADGAFAQDESEDRQTLQQQATEARARLEETAREVARLSAELGESYNRRLGEWAISTRRAQLGVNIEDAERGVSVVGVSPGGPADDAGIETGDIIVALDGAEFLANGDVRASEVLIQQLGNVDPGEEVTLTILRDDETTDFVVETSDMWRGLYAYTARDRLGPTVRALDLNRQYFNLATLGPMGRWRDMELIELTPELGEYFGTETGLLVVRAPADEQLQLVDGDVILDIGGRMPTSPEHAIRILRSFESGETLRVAIMRDQRRETLEFALPEPERPFRTN